MGLRVSICHGIRAFLLAAGRACRCIFAVRHALPAFWRRNVRFGEGPSAGIPDGTRRMRPEAGRNEAGGIVAGLRTPEALPFRNPGRETFTLEKNTDVMNYLKNGFLSLAFLLAAVAAGATAARDARPLGLTCNYAEEPLGMGDRRPSLGWRIDTGRPGYLQGAYRVLVASDRKLLEADRGDIWDSGIVREGRSQHVKFGGVPLLPCCDYYWKVKVWDTDGRRIGLESGGIVGGPGCSTSSTGRGSGCPPVSPRCCRTAGTSRTGGPSGRTGSWRTVPPYICAGRWSCLAGPQGDGVHLRTGLLRTLYQRPQGRRPGPGPAVHRLRQAGGVCGLRRYGPAGGGEQCRGHRAGQRLVQLADAGCLRHARRELAHAAEGEAEYRRRVRIGCARGDRHRPHVAVGPRRDRLQQRPVGRDDRPHPDRARLERGRIPRQPVAAGLPGSRSVGPSDGGPDAADARDRGVAGGTGRADLSRGLSGGFRREPHRLGRGAGAGRAGTDRRVAVQRGAEGRRLAGYAEQHVAHPRALSDRTADSRRGGHGRRSNPVLPITDSATCRCGG